MPETSAWNVSSLPRSRWSPSLSNIPLPSRYRTRRGVGALRAPRLASLSSMADLMATVSVAVIGAVDAGRDSIGPGHLADQAAAGQGHAAHRGVGGFVEHAAAGRVGDLEGGVRGAGAVERGGDVV